MEEKQQKVSIPMIHIQELSYKIIIPEEVENKIRLLCKEISNIEWSGVLFYKVSGSFEEENLVVTCLDIYQMDIGNSAYTEYTVDPSVAQYMLDHDLIDAYQGHIHSHHNMSTFFSGTDSQELKDGGSDTNHFVSLIVNNKGPYTAAITRKITTNKIITEEYSYNSFNNELFTGTRSYSEEEDYLEWYDLQIEIEGQNKEYEKEVLARIEEIKLEKSKIAERNKLLSNKTESLSKPYSEYSSYPFYSSYKEDKATSNISDKKDYYQQELPFYEDSEIPYDKIKIDRNIIMNIVKQMITSSAIIANGNIDLSKWNDALPKLYSTRFGDVKTFKEFAEPYVDFLINNIDESAIPDSLDLTTYSCILAYEVQKELYKMPSNIWINTYIEILNDYIL